MNLVKSLIFVALIFSANFKSIAQIDSINQVKEVQKSQAETVTAKTEKTKQEETKIQPKSKNNEDELSLKKGTIESQFEYIFIKSGNFIGSNGQKYEAVKLSSLNTLQANTLDSLKTLNSKLAESKLKIKKQTKEIENLKSVLFETKEILNNTKTEKDSMSLLNMQMSKTKYNSIMWLLVIVLLALLFTFIFKFKNSNKITKQSKNSLLDLEKEFEDHRRISLEREQKVRRQLQDEINKQKKT